MEENAQESNPVNYVIPLAIFVGVMAACGIVTLTLLLMAILVL